MATARSLSSHCLRSSHSAPAARTFTYLQLIAAERQRRPWTPLPLPVLDFLAPAATSALASTSRYTNTTPTPPTRPHLPSLSRYRFQSAPTSPSPPPPASRPFSTNSIHLQPQTQFQSQPQTQPQPQTQTIAIHNPRKDDNGEEIAIEITPRAACRLKEIMIKDANPHLALRITVESGGCHGFQYLMSLTTLNASTAGSQAVSPALEEDDTVFEATDGSGARVVMDGPSLELLKGSKIDYTTELIGSQFKIVDNPLATSSCGCGTSFDIKI